MTGQRRRLTARSVIASTLLGVDPPELTTRSLVATAELLGVAPGTARVAMSRMVGAGELEATRDGYRLVSRALLDRQARQGASRAGTTLAWDGTWRTHVVTDEGRTAPERAELRTAMAAARTAELREGVWMRPDNLGPPAARTAIDVQCTTMSSTVADPLELAVRLWDLDAWQVRASRLLEEVIELTAPLESGDASVLAQGFVVSADVLRHLGTDPLLPVDLVDPAWVGPELRESYDAFDRAFRATLAQWQRRRGPD